MLAELLALPAPTLLLAACAIAAAYSLARVLADPLRDVPGPLLARVTRFWYLLEIYRGGFERVNVELHRRYGPLVRVAPGEYSVDDVEAARLIYGHGSGFVKAPWYWAWMPPDPSKASLFADLDPHRHGVQRRKYAAAYSMSSLVGYEPYVDNCTALLVQRFAELAGAESAPANMGHWLQCYAFDVIGEITFGSRFGFLDAGVDEAGVFRAIDQRGQYSTFVGIFPWLHAILYPLLPKSGGHGYVAAYTLKQMESREKQLRDASSSPAGRRDGPPDFMSRFLAVHEAEGGAGMSKLDIFTICQSNIGAGSDTTAITLSALFYHLLRNPASLARLVAEIDAAHAAGQLSDSAPVTFAQAQQLPYLQAVVKEALRLHSATGLPLQRVVPRGGAQLAGRHVPAGTHVGINAWVAHRNRTVFGPDADAWRPERWIELQQQGRGADAEKYFFAFGMGSRTCIGRNISLLEIQKLVPALLRRFDFRLAGDLPRRPWRTENRWFVKPLDFDVVVALRPDVGRA